MRTRASEPVHTFIAMRFMALTCMLLLTPLVVWSAVLGMVGVCVAVVWMATLGVRTAAGWGSARARGASNARAAAQAGALPAYATLVAGVASSVLIGAGVRRFSPVGEWVEATGVVMPVTGVLVLFLSALPGVVAVLVSVRRHPASATSTEQDGLQPEDADEPRAGRLGRGPALVIAGVVGVVNVWVLLAVTPLSRWIEGSTVEALVAGAALVVAVAIPAIVAWYASDRGEAT